MARWLQQGLLAIAALVTADSALAQSEALNPPSLTACPASEPPPVDPGSTRIHPGHWHNPKRWGTGWDFYFFDSNTKMIGFWYAFETNGVPVWYRTSIIEYAPGAATWSGDLLRIKMVGGAQQATTAGQISGRFFPGTATRMGLRWTLPGYSNPPEECIVDIYRESLLNSSGGMSEATPSYTGNWGDAQRWGWGYHYSGNRLGSSMDFHEAEKLLIFDVQGNPVWLSALSRTVNAEPPNSVTDRLLNYSSGRHRLDVDCTDDEVNTPNYNECVRNWPLEAPNVAKFSRTFNSFSSASVSVTVNIQNSLYEPGTGYILPNRQIIWPHPSMDFAPAGNEVTNPSALTRNSLVDHVYVDNSYCVAPTSASLCRVYIAWATRQPNAVLNRVNMATNAPTYLSNAEVGSQFDDLPPGSRVRYELRDANTNALISASAEVLVTVATIGGGDSTLGAPDTPPAPAAFQEPVLDSASDKVGALAATFKVNEAGHATYSIPLYVPRGRGGLTPSVALNYSSAGAEGLLGTGFDLSAASSIQKCRAGKEFGDGNVTPVELTELCLDGQRLLLWKGTHLQPGAVYRTEIESFQRIVIESAPVIAASTYGLMENVQTYTFIVHGKDGSVRRFGDIAGSVLARLTFNRAAAISWLQTSLADVSNNSLQAERTLSSITYTGGRIDFAYTGSGRRDLSHSVLGDAYATQILAGVTVSGADNTVLRHYAVTYATQVLGLPGLQRPRVSRITECADTSLQVCYEPTEFGWNDPSPRIAFGSGNTDADGGKLFPGLVSHRLGDFNGDGRADIAWTDNQGRLYVRYASANAKGILFTSGSLPSSQAVAQLSGVDPIGAFQTLDFDADGFDDLLYLALSSTDANQVSWYLKRSGQSGFLAAEELLANVGQKSPNESVKYESSLVDHTGDGLPDLLFRIGMDSHRIALLQRDPSSQARPYSFRAPIRVVLKDNTSAPLHMCALSTYTARRDEERPQVVDVDGDGRGDLAMMSSDAACASEPHQTGDLGATGSNRLKFYLVTYSAKGETVGVGGQPEFLFQRSGRTLQISEGQGPDAARRARQRVMVADVNADGFADFVYLTWQNKWMTNLTVAHSQYGEEFLVADGLYDNHLDKVQVLDFDGDGKLDFWWPNSASKYQIYLWKGDGHSSTAISSDFVATPGNDWLRLPADYDGDGLVDNVVVKAFSGASHDGGWQAYRSQSHHQPRGMLVSIRNGLGAVTEIDYSPLTFSSVYRRDYDGPLRDWGRTSPVFDMAMPSFITHYVRSSAPTPGNPTNQAIVQYQYRGLKIQAGGRGSLGFARVSTIDLQTSMAVDTYLHNEFPMTGLPFQTRTRKLSTIPQDSCRSGGNFVETSACFSRVEICPSGKLHLCDASLPEPSALVAKNLSDTWGWRYQPHELLAGARELNYSNQSMSTVPVLAKAPISPVFLGRILSNQYDYDFDSGTPLSFMAMPFTALGYDDFGNVLTARVLTRRRGLPQTGEDDTLVETETRHSYANDSTSWKLGRLLSSLTFTRRTDTRGGVQNVTTLGRRASFTYADPFNPSDSRGLLHSEKVEGMLGGSIDALGPDGSVRYMVNYYEHDAAGNRLATFSCGNDIAESQCRSRAGFPGYVFHTWGPQVMRYARSVYDSMARYPDITYEAVSTGADASTEIVTSSVTARNSGGDVLTLRDANGNLSQARYGKLGRKRYSYAPNGASERTDWARCTPSICPSNMALAFVMTTTVSGAPTRWSFHDILGRPTVNVQQGFEATDFIATLIQYDNRGNEWRTSTPFFVSNAGAGAATLRPGAETYYWNTTWRDLAGRIYRVAGADGSDTRKQFLGLTTVTTLTPNGSGQVQTSTEETNAQGQLVAATDANGLKISYSYDAGGNLLRASRNNKVTVSTYDTLGRKLSTSDPDTGTWTYGVNDAGDIITQAGPRGYCTALRYDGRGRLWQRIDYVGACATTAAAAVTTFSFDTAAYGSGLVAAQEYTESGAVSMVRRYDYNGIGQLVGVRTEQDGKSYVSQSTFDQHGRPFQSFFTAANLPTTGERNEYNAQGYSYRLRSAYPAASGAIYNEVLQMNQRGKVVRERKAVNVDVTTTREFDPRSGRLRQQRVVDGGGAAAQDLRYDYDNIGNMLYRESLQGGVAQRETFAYDKLQRLTGSVIAYNGSTIATLTQIYDGEGNLTSKGGRNYTYGTLAAGCNGYAIPGPHAVSVAGSTSYCYDIGGNVLRISGSGDSRTLTYNAYDLVRSVRSDSNNRRTDYNYGPLREKIRRLDYASATALSAEQIVEYVGEAEVRLVAGVIEEVTRHAGPVIVRQKRGGMAYPASQQYLFRDVQGSTDLVLDVLGRPVNASAKMSFDAFGQRRDAATWTAATPWSGALRAELQATTRRGYTGHEQADEIGIVHMNGRIYDPALGRFLQADPFVQAPTDSQSFNRYSYVFNNPMAYTDPSGYFGSREQDGVRTGVAIVISIFLPQVLMTNLSLTTTQAAIVTGALAGGVQSGNVRGAAMGALTAAAFSGIDAAFDVNPDLQWGGLSQQAYAARALSYAAAGGVLNTVQGGRFGHGFANAGLSTLLSPAGPGGKQSGSESVFDAFGKAVAAGTVSAVSGGSFVNGALTGAFSQAVAALKPARAMAHAEACSTPTPGSWTPEAVAAYEKMVSELDGAVRKTVRETADLFGSAAGEFSARFSLEVGANILPVKGGFTFDNFTRGGGRSISVPNNNLSVAWLHSHPTYSCDGFSGAAEVLNGNYKIYDGDYAVSVGRNLSAYVYRGGSNPGAWYFDAPKFNAALGPVIKNGGTLSSRWSDYTQRIR